jgi:cytoskeleton protein RodZ
MSDTSKNNSNGDMFATPGQMLHSQREKQKLSIEEIATRIHLDVKIIEAIENDSSEGMPAAIYVRGYLRSYAKIVGADADEVIKLYNSDSPPPPPEILPEVKPPSQISSNDKPVKAFTYFITLGLVLLLLIWYQSNFVVDNRTDAEQANTPTNINGTDVTYSVINHPESWKSPNNIAEKENEESTAAEPFEQNNELEIITAIDEITAVESSSTEATPEEITTENSPLSVRGYGPDKIEMTLTSDSWIEIQDANDNRLFHDLARAGRQYSINGTAPITVLLGFSAGVTIKFNGKPFDIAPHSNGGVAHFILPE